MRQGRGVTIQHGPQCTLALLPCTPQRSSLLGPAALITGTDSTCLLYSAWRCWPSKNMLVQRMPFQEVCIPVNNHHHHQIIILILCSSFRRKEQHKNSHIKKCSRTIPLTSFSQQHISSNAKSAGAASLLKEKGLHEQLSRALFVLTHVRELQQGFSKQPHVHVCQSTWHTLSPVHMQSRK